MALRFSNIMEPDDYERFPSFWADARLRRWNLWGYVDALSIEKARKLLGYEPRHSWRDHIEA